MKVIFELNVRGEDMKRGKLDRDFVAKWVCVTAHLVAALIAAAIYMFQPAIGYMLIAGCYSVIAVSEAYR